MCENEIESQNKLEELIRKVCKEEIEKYDREKSMDLTKGLKQITPMYIPFDKNKNIPSNYVTTSYGCIPNMTYDSNKETKIYYQCPYGD
jgi:hypothetical protein